MLCKSSIYKSLVKVHITGKGIDRILNLKRGDNVLSEAEKAEIHIPNACEGNCACGTCMVYVKKGENLLKSATDKEYDTLDFAPLLRDESRLACCCIIDADEGEIDLELPMHSRNII